MFNISKRERNIEQTKMYCCNIYKKYEKVVTCKRKEESEDNFSGINVSQHPQRQNTVVTFKSRMCCK